MSTKVQAQTQAKTPAGPTAARIPQPRVAELEPEAERRDLVAQLEGAARLGHSWGAISVRSAAPSLIQPKLLIQRQEVSEEDEEELQMKPEPDAIQRQRLPSSPVTPHVETAIQRATGGGAPEVRQENRAGLPDHLKAGLESLSGISMDDVMVHYNSSKPREINAHAFTQGRDIHIAPGQEEHLPHEGWHVVQQTKGRVKPIRMLKGGININDDDGLEREADIVGANAQNYTCLLEDIEYSETRCRPSSVVQQKTKEEEIGDQANLGVELEFRNITLNRTDRNWDEQAGLEDLTTSGNDGKFVSDQHQKNYACIEWSSAHPPFSEISEGKGLQDKVDGIITYLSNYPSGTLPELVAGIKKFIDVGEVNKDQQRVTYKSAGRTTQTQINLEVPFEKIGKIQNGDIDTSGLFSGVKSKKAATVFKLSRGSSRALAKSMVEKWNETRTGDEQGDVAEDSIASLLTIFLHTGINAATKGGKEAQGVLFKTGAGDLARTALKPEGKRVLWFCIHQDKEKFIEKMGEEGKRIYAQAYESRGGQQQMEIVKTTIMEQAERCFKVLNSNESEEKGKRWPGEEKTQGYGEAVNEYESLYLSGVQTGKFFPVSEYKSKTDSSVKAKYLIAEIRRIDNEINSLIRGDKPLEESERKKLAEKIRKLQMPC